MHSNMQVNKMGLYKNIQGESHIITIPYVWLFFFWHDNYRKNIQRRYCNMFLCRHGKGLFSLDGNVRNWSIYFLFFSCFLNYSVICCLVFFFGILIITTLILVKKNYFEHEFTHQQTDSYFWHNNFFYYNNCNYYCHYYYYHYYYYFYDHK